MMTFNAKYFIYDESEYWNNNNLAFDYIMRSDADIVAVQEGDVWAKVREELGELEEELRRGDKEKSKEELGDFLFSVINAARLYHINPDTALELTNNKFIRRFNYIEQHSIKAGKPLTEMTLEEMDKLWLEAKKNE